MSKPWAVTEDVFLLKNKDEMTHFEIGQVLGRNKYGVKARVHVLSKENKTIKQLEYQEKYIIENHKTQTRAELAASLGESTSTITFRIIAFEDQGKLNSADVPVKLKYLPREKPLENIDLPVAQMPKKMVTIEDYNEGTRFDNIKVNIGKTYDVTIHDVKENSTKYINQFKGKAIYDGPYFVVLRSKTGYNLSFLKANIAIGETTLKEVLY